MTYLTVNNRSHQSGIALITALLLLILVTIIVVSGSRNTLLQERMAGNMYDRNLAFQGAEATLSAAIRTIQSGANIPAIAPVATPTDPDFWENYLNNDQSPGLNLFINNNLDLAQNPRFVIEELESQASIIADEPIAEPWFRITAISEGGTTNAVVILHAGYRR